MKRASSRKSTQLQIRVSTADKAALARLARRAGQDLSSYVLAHALPAARTRFAELARSLVDEGSRRYALAQLSDWLVGLAPAELGEASAEEALGRLEPWLRNYVAAMVERAAQRKGVAPPAWVRDIEPLDAPYFATDLVSLRPHLLRASPVVFKRRNLFVDASVGERV